MTTAADICAQAVEAMEERAKTYDDEGAAERSMGKVVAAFNAITGHNLSEEQGWHFMTLLKMVRAQQGDYQADNYVDGAAYFALAGECAFDTRHEDTQDYHTALEVAKRFVMSKTLAPTKRADFDRNSLGTSVKPHLIWEDSNHFETN